jgi:hypothetical protein
VARLAVTGRRIGAPKKKQQRFHLDRRADLIADKVESEGKADDLLTSCRLADSLDVTEQWVITTRRDNCGPPFIQPFPEVIRYRRGDVTKWLRARAPVCGDGRKRLSLTHHENP